MGEEIKPEETGEKQDTKFKPGQSGNPAGRPKGSENFSTKFRKFIEKVADQNEITPEEVEEQLMAIGYKEAKAGDFRFWADIFNRVYGKPKETVEHSVDENISEVEITIRRNEIKDRGDNSSRQNSTS
jgi:hypothetical protein